MDNINKILYKIHYISGKNNFLLKEDYLKSNITSENLSKLYNYLKMNDIEKKESLVELFPIYDMFMYFLEETNINFKPNNIGYELDLTKIPSHILQKYGEWLYNHILNKSLPEMHPAFYPSWFYLKNPEPLQNSTLIHFTHDDATKIAKEGFTAGYDDYRILGLTTQLQNFYPEKKYEKGIKYNFGYDVHDVLNYIEDNQIPASKYGYDFVLFNADAIKAYHELDNENQAIFSNNTIKSKIFPAIVNENDDGYVLFDGDKPIYDGNSVSDITNWALANVL